jgi:transforming growth factor-beta-induced protein
VKAAGLVETLSGKGPFTVLAPTDEAFAKLPAGTLDMLLKPENKQQLVDILTYHVVPAAAYADQVVTMSQVPTVLKTPIKVTVKDGKVMLGAATVVATDIEASNGVIHVVDTVILPTPANKAQASVDTNSSKN